MTSLLGGICLANAKLGAVHGFAGVLGGMCEVAPHGAICGLLLPIVFKKNAAKLKSLASQGDAAASDKFERFTEVSRLVTGNPSATVEDGIFWLQALVEDLQVPSLQALCGVNTSQFDEIATITSTASSTKGNPIPLTIDELKEILQEAL